MYEFLNLERKHMFDFKNKKTSGLEKCEDIWILGKNTCSIQKTLWPKRTKYFKVPMNSFKI